MGSEMCIRDRSFQAQAITDSLTLCDQPVLFLKLCFVDFVALWVLMQVLSHLALRLNGCHPPRAAGRLTPAVRT